MPMTRKTDKALLVTLAVCGLRFVGSATAQGPLPTYRIPRTSASPQVSAAAPLGFESFQSSSGTIGGVRSSGSDLSPYPGPGGSDAAFRPGDSAIGGLGAA